MMIKKFPALLLYLTIIITPRLMAMEVDTVQLRDMSREWYFYHPGEKQLLPLVDRSLFKGNTIQFEITMGDLAGNLLRINSGQEISLFINNQIIDVFSGERYFDQDFLHHFISEDSLTVILYNEKLSPYALSVDLININNKAEGALADAPVIIKSRTFDAFNDFVVVVVLLLAGFLAAMFNYFPRFSADFFKMGRVVSFRDTDENIFKTRPFSRINLLYYVYTSMLIAAVLIILINRSGVYPSASLFYPSSFGDGIWNWLQLTITIFAVFFLKYLLVTNMTALFALKGFSVLHFYNYVRFQLLTFILVLFIILFSLYGMGVENADYYLTLFKIVFILGGIGILVLYFKLLSTSSYKSLHLFSYLCATEVIPFVILLDLGLNQPF